MSTFLQDIRFALRSLRHNPGFAVTAVLTLGLGIGANVAIFSVVNGVLLRPLPFPASDRLVMVWGHHPQIGRESASLPDFVDWRAGGSALQHLAAYANTRFTVTGSGEAEMVRGAFVTADFFQTLGVTPLRGRSFTSGEDARGTERVVMLGEAFWRRRFGGDPGLIGRQVELNATAYTVVGIAPSTARLEGAVDAWTPLRPDSTMSRRSDFLHVVGRLAPGASLARAGEELASVARGLAERYPETNKGWSIEIAPLQEAVVGAVRPALVLFMAAVGLVLLIACANMANLLLARAAARTQEVGIRTALGASRGRLVRQLLTESILLGLAGGAVGLLLAAWGVQGLRHLQPGTLPRLEEINLDGRAFAFAVALSTLTGLLFGVLPAMRLTGRALSPGLHGSSRSVAGGPGLRNLRGALVLTEVALAFILLAGAGLLVRSFDHLLRVEPGFRTDGLLTARLLLPGAKYADEAKQTAFYEQLGERLAAVPGVRWAALVSDAPLGDSPPYVAFSIQGRPAVPDGVVQDLELFSASPAYFSTLGVPLLQGRSFDDRDRPKTPGVAIINQVIARRYFAGRSPLGERLTFDDPTDSTARWYTVVGVVGDIHHAGLSEPPYPQMYLPLAQAPRRWMVVVLRTGTDPLGLAPAARRALASVDPDLALSELRTMDQRISEITARPRVSAFLLGSFAVAALLLAAIGIYGVISYGVIQRTRELGIRMALGAGSHNVLGLVLRQGMMPVAAGIAAGMAGAWAASRLLRSLLFEVGATDPATFAAVTLFLTGFAAGACYLPARRAARMDPVVALRSE
jgi:putative ABC transport system permease protein